MVEISISDAISKIQSSKIKERDEGLKDLKHVFTHNRQSPSLEALNNKGYHQLFEKLFRVAQSERSNYAKTVGTFKKQPVTKLPACANLLRTAVEIGVRKIRYKTVKAVIEHIIQILPGVDEHYCEPLANDYVKALRAILSYSPHPEHLPKDAWQVVVDFCNEGIRAYVSSLDETRSSSLAIIDGSNRFSGPLSRSSTLDSSENVANKSFSSASKNGPAFHMRTIVEELTFCLQYLYCASNAPVLEKARETIMVLLKLLRSSFPLGQEHQAAFATTNAVLSHTMTEDVDLTRKIIREIVPLVQRHWIARSTTLKEEMLITLTYTGFLMPTLTQTNEMDGFLGSLQCLADIMQAEYSKKSEREQLQFDDLQLATIADDNCRVPLSTRAFFLRSGGAKAEQAWATLDTIALTLTTLHHPRHTPTVTSDLGPPHKRQMVMQPVDNLLQQLRLNLSKEKATALQILTFVGDRQIFDSTTLKTLIESLMPFISSDAIPLSNWAMLAAASIAQQQASTELDSKLWLQIWQLAARNVTSVSTSQTACYIMTVLLNRHLVEFSDIADVVDNMLSSVDLNGPATFTESAVSLWCVLMDLKARISPSSVHDTSERILRWLFVRWSPSKLDDRHRAAKLAHHCLPSSILKLLSSILGIQHTVLNHISKIPEYNSISQAKFRCIRYKRLVRYLILTEVPLVEKTMVQKFLSEQALVINLSDSRFQYLLKLVVDFLLSEITIISNESAFSGPEGIQGVNVDTIASCCSACVVCFGILGSPRVSNTGKVQQLRSKTTQLRSNIAGHVLRQDDPKSLIDGLFKSFGNFLDVSSYDTTNTDLLASGVREMSSHFGPSFWKQLHNAEANKDTDADMMELDDTVEPQRILDKGGNVLNEVPHEEVAAMTNHRAYQASMTARICFFSTLKPRLTKLDHVLLPLEYVEHLTSLAPNEFLACRSFLKELLESGIDVDERCGCLILNYLGDKLLHPYEFERCEVASGVCLDTMSSLAKEWTDFENAKISGLGSDIYKWFTDITLKDGVTSPHVQLRMAAMLQHVIKVGPESSRTSDLPSARTTLFKILKNGSAAVIFYVGLGISDLFGLFILKEHEPMLEDLIHNLPGDPDWTEGIALRLFVLAHLGSSWYTLLRRCVYAIFETPRHVISSTEHATNCVKYLADKLCLKSPTELFKLFVSQIMYTWLEIESLISIPFAIFGYSSLSGLLADVQDEITGQITMRGREDEVQQVVKHLETTFENLLEVSFSKAAAYSIGRDAAVPPTRDMQAAGAEVRLRKRLGKECYGQLMEKNFPEILCLFFMIIDQEDNIQKGFQKHKAYEAAGHTYDEIISIGASTMTLPINQQPCFKARYLVDEIEYLCQRTGRSSSGVWTSALYVYVFRELLNSIHTALGSLHTCSVIRRLRVLVCMAGETALRDYPLEMALRSLRPFLTDIHCAEDVIGICGYLIGHSTEYLQQVPSFLAGFIVSTLVSMKAFLTTPQESTTQESQYRDTMSKAQEFHLWLGTLGDKYTAPILPAIAEQSFKVMVSSARQLRGSGSAKKGTYEADLLMELLEDQRSGRLLINHTSKSLILSLLCSSFDVPVDFRDDILGDAKQALTFAPVIWDTCHNGVFGPEYLLWAGRVLGRAYCFSGSIDSGILREVKLEIPQSNTNSPQYTLNSQSRSMILILLAELIHTDDRQDVGLAETTLQRIVTKAIGTSFSTECETLLPPSLLNALIWEPYICPADKFKACAASDSLGITILNENLAYTTWIEHVCIALTNVFPDDAVLSELAPILSTVEGLPGKMFKYILHLVLLEEADAKQTVKGIVSDAAQQWFGKKKAVAIPYVKLILHAVLHLRCQPMIREATKADRTGWLDFDYKQAAEAAIRCQMFKTALLFIEIDASGSAKASRRSSERNVEQPNDTLLCIFQNLDDRDSIYGIQLPSSISSAMEQLEYENAGFKSLSFRGASYDSKIRYSNSIEQGSEESMIQILDRLDLSGLSQSLLVNLNSTNSTSTEAMVRTARKLERWDITIPPRETGQASVVFKVFQGIHNASNLRTITDSLNIGYSTTMNNVLRNMSTLHSFHATLSSLAVLTEIEEVLSARNLSQLKEACSNFESRKEWMIAGSLEYVSNISSCRETLLSVLSKSGNLQRLLNVSARNARETEVRTLLFTSGLSRHHRAVQSALKTATYLAQIVQPCKDLGLNVEAAVQYEGSNVLWDQNEMLASIRMLEWLVQNADMGSQDIHVSRSELLAKLGHRISEARLEKPDEIIAKYLIPAIKGLRGITQGVEAGQAFHEFAFFCDQQLQNHENIEDYERMRRLRDRKEGEVRELDRMIRSVGSQSKERDNLKNHRTKAKQWFELDDREFQRLRKNRQTFLCQSLENYLLSLKACDTYDSDALRFSALWLEHSEEEAANVAVSKNIAMVSSGKLATLMNQWASRLLDVPSQFQGLLASLVLRICIDHPYHGMYQMFASSKTRGGKDEAALARNAAAMKIVNQYKNHKRVSSIWISLHNTSVSYVKFASEKLEDSKIKPGSKVLLRKSALGPKIEQDVSIHKVPPPTMKIQLRSDCDYSGTPMIAKFSTEFSVASGISMPKILTATTSDGKRYKMLVSFDKETDEVIDYEYLPNTLQFKSGNDDLRQDSIMEQVFEQVSNLLQTHRETRQRNLGIRTYKVLPLTATSGIIEFVPDTIPLHDYLMPAHQRHFPGDWKTNVCRKHIADVQSKPVDHRIKVFKQVIERFHPVMRYFFMERFENPDDWYERRLAYTRSTAAISILGHVLGLGDRHGHNILLDETTGEVVHIDLGIAFEQGRVLPIPEVVPFRLTRDLVDGMGITGTKGVFQRCCEFTLEALRSESYTIMTILDVLRYDPLYSWSLSPLRLQKLQNEQDEGHPPVEGEEEMNLNKRKDDEPGEADRALTVVSKKLSKSLSVTATVNELIQQATDVKNLAVLFCGWAAYA